MITSTAALVLLAAAKCSAEGAGAIRGGRHLEGDPEPCEAIALGDDGTFKDLGDATCTGTWVASTGGDGTHYLLQAKKQRLEWVTLDTPGDALSSCEAFHCRVTSATTPEISGEGGDVGGDTTTFAPAQTFPMHFYGGACVCDFYGFDTGPVDAPVNLDDDIFTIEFLLPVAYDEGAAFGVVDDKTVITKQHLEQRLFSVKEFNVEAALGESSIKNQDEPVLVIKSNFQNSQYNSVDCAVESFTMSIACGNTFVSSGLAGDGGANEHRIVGPDLVSDWKTEIPMEIIDTCATTVLSKTEEIVFNVELRMHSVVTTGAGCDRDDIKLDVGSVNDAGSTSVQSIFKPAFVDGADGDTVDGKDVVTRSFQIKIHKWGSSEVNEGTVTVTQVVPRLGLVEPADESDVEICGSNFEPMAKPIIPLIVSLDDMDEETDDSSTGTGTTTYSARGTFQFINMKLGDMDLKYESGCEDGFDPAESSGCAPKDCDATSCTIGFTIADCQAQKVETEDANNNPTTCTFEDIAQVQGSVEYTKNEVTETALIKDRTPEQRSGECGSVAATQDVSGEYEVTTTVTPTNMNVETPILVTLLDFASPSTDSHVTFVIEKVVITAKHPNTGEELTLANGGAADSVTTVLNIDGHNKYGADSNHPYSSVTWCRKQKGKSLDQDNACTLPPGDKCTAQRHADQLFVTLNEFDQFGDIVDTNVEVTFDLTLRLTNCPGAEDRRRLETGNVPQLIYTSKTVAMAAGSCDVHDNRAACNQDKLVLGGCMWTKLKDSKKKCYPRPTIFNEVDTPCNTIKDSKVCLERQECFRKGDSKGCRAVTKCEQYETKGQCKQDLANLGGCKPKVKDGEFIKCRTKST